jgi:lipid-binding SYLF domain-containing protein
MFKSLVFRLLLVLLFVAQPAFADKYSDALSRFKKSTQSQSFFANSYGYALFPTVGKGGFIVGAAHGKGKVYRGSAVTGDSSVTQVSIGFQLGGEAFSEIVFFENKAAYDEFTSGKFEFRAQAQAVVIVAGAQAQSGTTGSSSGAGVPGAAVSKGVYHNGMAVFTSIKGGLMYEASLAGQKFTFEPA